MNEQQCFEIAERIKRDANVAEHLPVPDRTFAGIDKGKIVRGCADAENRIVYAPAGRSPSELYVLAHECGHVHLQHHLREDPSSLIELEADEYARRVLASHGVPIDYVLQLDAAAMICYSCARDMKGGIDAPPAVQQFIARNPLAAYLVSKSLKEAA